MFTTVNPATGETLGSYSWMDAGEVDRALQRSAEAQQAWRRVPVAERAGVVAKLAPALRQAREPLARSLAQEMGKPITAGLAEIEKTASAVEWFTAEAPDALASVPIAMEDGAAQVHLLPLGPLLAIMPWNYPFWQSLRFAVPALLAGNTVLIKHSPVTTGTGLLLQEVLASCLSDGVTDILVIQDPAAHEVIADPRVRGVTLTGSTRAGRAVAETAGRSLKKVVLELGGSAPFVVLPDADVQGAALAAVASRMQNTGQSCIAAKRMIVHDSVAEEFHEAFRSAAAALQVGDPLDPATDLGPMATASLRNQLHRQVEETVSAGARVVLGGDPPPGPGSFYPPTLLVDVPPHTPSAEEEVFGPAAGSIRADTVEEQVRIANATEFGLGANIWTRNLAGAHELAGRIDAGFVAINDFVRSDPRLPFGGVKNSGLGRELGIDSFREFTNVQSRRSA